MATAPDTSELVERWRSLVTRFKSVSSSRDKCVILREILQEIDFHRSIGKVSEDCYKVLRGKYEKEYKKNLANVAKTVDVEDTNGSEVVVDSSDSVQNSIDNDCRTAETSNINGHVNSDIIVESNEVAKPGNVEPGFTDKRFSEDSKPGREDAGFTDDRLSNLHPTLREVMTQPHRFSSQSDVYIEKVQKPTRKPMGEGNILACWNISKKSDKKEPLIPRPEKRKYESDSPISKKTVRADTDDKMSDFLTAREQLQINNFKKNQGRSGNGQFVDSGRSRELVDTPVYGKAQKSLGTRRGLSSQFIPPVPGNTNSQAPSQSKPTNTDSQQQYTDPIYQDERLKSCEPRMIELILNEIMDNGPKMSWDDIAGLEFAKKTIQEIVVWPMLRPDIFTGLRGPPKGLLLFGPPGNGKTIIGKCIASQSNSTFFTISASSLTSKWVGEGEKMVRTLFTVARCYQPAVVFIDEIDSLLTQRSDQEHESSRRIKTEFLVQLDGACTASDERLLVIGATNRPQEIDEAARRRFVKRLYIPLPDQTARSKIVRNLLVGQKSDVSDDELVTIGERTDGYSGADMANLCKEAALGPIRSIPFGDIHKIAAEDVRSIQFVDFTEALDHVKASVSTDDLTLYIEWNNKFGSGKW